MAGFQPMRIAGSVPTGLIRRAYDEGRNEMEGDAAALRIGHQVLEDATDEQILAIAHRKARIDGVSPDCKYTEEDDE